MSTELYIPNIIGKKGSGHINTDHRYMGVRFYFEADREIWMPKFKEIKK